MMIIRKILMSRSYFHLVTRDSSTVTYYSKLMSIGSSNTLKSADDETVSLSQRLMQSEGLIHCSSPGSFVLMPSSVRIVEKLVRLIDQEMRAIGGQKIQMPSLIPTSLLRRSGRLDRCSSELFTCSKQDMILAPTHEELVSQLVHSIPGLSYRSFPLYLYQITSKFRNERRPRSGLLRAREFLMKDMYTFDVDVDAAEQTYARVTRAYEQIFRRLRIPVSRVEADPGDIGGSLSHEFHVLSDAGQDKILICSACGHAMNQELLESRTKPITASSTSASADPGRREDDARVRISCSGDAESHGDGSQAEEVVRLSDEGTGDPGSRQKDQEREMEEEVVLKCGNCHVEGLHVQKKGIEVGHTFLLGTKYTQSFDVKFADTQGKQVVSQMGCYGVGVTRLLAASLEALSPDQRHMTWPQIITPFHVVVIPPKSGSREETAIGPSLMHHFADRLASSTGLDVLLDDRCHLTIGRRLRDHERSGVPFAVVAGKSAALSSIPMFELLSFPASSPAPSHQQHRRRHHHHRHPGDDAVVEGGGGAGDQWHGIADLDPESEAGVKSGEWQPHPHPQFLTYSQTMDYFSKPDFLCHWLL